ncbi:MAG: single-stranded-DNA-specific exonuclease RecJ [Lachnospiraceae bacterium]|nr:single-stranded-DNA-specific exonuclease RecJ [Lachnospiraceae bacterium]
MKEKWIVHSKRADFDAVGKKFGISPITARIIRNRDIITDEEINMYLNGSLEELYSPWLLKDMEKAVNIIEEKIVAGKSIRIVGDYDIDGVCAGNILVKGLDMLDANVSFVVPDRIIDGYGINDRIIDEALEEGVDTIITCDNGIAAYDTISYGKQKGLTIIITDHHEVPENIPPADAVIDARQKDCKYPYKELCGASIAYKLICALHNRIKGKLDGVINLLELAAIATIGDVVDLKDENRIIAKYGLGLINSSPSKGVQALINANELKGKKITAYHIGFVIGPCLNAGGRLDTAMKSYMVIKGDAPNLDDLALELKELNDERKAMTIDNTELAINIVDSNKEYLTQTVLVVYLPECHESLAGIVAGRIRERYNKPTFVITKGETILKGSGRSIEGYNMYEELVKCEKYLAKYGGHEMAAGLSIEENNLEKFIKLINSNSKLTDEDLVQKVWIDVPMPFNYVKEELIEELSRLEPFGKANTKPVFAEKNVKLLRATVLGQNRNVIRLNMVNEYGYRMEGTFFSTEEEFVEKLENRFSINEINELLNGKDNGIMVSVTYYPEINEYKGNRYIRVIVDRII